MKSFPSLKGNPLQREIPYKGKSLIRGNPFLNGPEPHLEEGAEGERDRPEAEPFHADVVDFRQSREHMCIHIYIYIYIYRYLYIHTYIYIYI